MGQNWRGGPSKSDELPTGPGVNGSFVYLIGRAEEGPTKIGISATPRKRVKSIETSLGERFDFLWASDECMNAQAIEASLLEKLRQHRTIGEWVALPFQFVVEIVSREKFVAPDYKAHQERLRRASNKIRPINEPNYPRV